MYGNSKLLTSVFLLFKQHFFFHSFIHSSGAAIPTGQALYKAPRAQRGTRSSWPLTVRRSRLGNFYQQQRQQNTASVITVPSRQWGGWRTDDRTKSTSDGCWSGSPEEVPLNPMPHPSTRRRSWGPVERGCSRS